MHLLTHAKSSSNLNLLNLLNRCSKQKTIPGFSVSNWASSLVWMPPPIEATQGLSAAPFLPKAYYGSPAEIPHVSPISRPFWLKSLPSISLSLAIEIIPLNRSPMYKINCVDLYSHRVAWSHTSTRPSETMMHLLFILNIRLAHPRTTPSLPMWM